MQIDWVTVAAQIINFLVLVWVLQRLLYRPITRAMQRREQRIEDRLRQAAQKQADADREAQLYREKRAELEKQKDDLLQQARNEAQTFRQTLEKDARAEVNKQRESWHAQLTEEKEEFLRDLHLQTAHHVYETCRSVLLELANVELENSLATRFAEHLNELDHDHVEKILRSAADTDNIVLVQSQFELPPSVKNQITKIIHEVISPDLEVQYQTEAGTGLGIRFRAGGQFVEWSVSHYLEELEKSVEERLSGLLNSSQTEVAA